MKFKFINFNIDEKLLNIPKKETIKESNNMGDREDKIFNKFYKYSGITPGTKITEKDIDDHWLGAFGRIGFEEGLTNEGLKKILLSR